MARAPPLDPAQRDSRQSGATRPVRSILLCLFLIIQEATEQGERVFVF